MTSDASWVRLPAASPVADWLKAGVDDEAAEDPGRRVARTERDELLVGVDVVAVADAERRAAPIDSARARKTIPKAPVARNTMSPNGIRGQPGSGTPVVDVADDRDALAAQVERPSRQAIPPTSATSAPGIARGDAAEHDDHDQRADAERPAV